MYIYFFGSYDFKYKYSMNELQKCSRILLQYCEHFFLEVISKNVIVVGTELENKIIQINLPQKKYVLSKKQMKRLSVTDCMLIGRLQVKNGFTFLVIKIMLNQQHNRSAQNIETTRGEDYYFMVS